MKRQRALFSIVDPCGMQQEASGVRYAELYVLPA